MEITLKCGTKVKHAMRTFDLSTNYSKRVHLLHITDHMNVGTITGVWGADKALTRVEGVSLAIDVDELPRVISFLQKLHDAHNEQKMTLEEDDDASDEVQDVST